MPAAFFGPAPRFQFDQTLNDKPLGATLTAAEANNSLAYEGQLFMFAGTPRDRLPNAPMIGRRGTLCMAVRNATTAITNPAALTNVNAIAGNPTYAGTVCKMQDNAGNTQAGISYLASRTLGGSSTVGDLAYPMSHLILGLAANDVAWFVVDGVACVATASATDDTNVGESEFVIPSVTTAGRVQAQNTGVAAGSATFDQIQGVIARSLQDIGAEATNTKNCSLFVNVGS